MAKKVASKKTEEVQTPEPIIQTHDVDTAIEKRLIALYTLQSIDTAIDKINTIRGELPEAIRELEDEIEGLHTRIGNFENAVKENNSLIARKQEEIRTFEADKDKRENQLNTIRNNREYESLKKEIEYDELNIKAAQKKISEAENVIKADKQRIDAANEMLKERNTELESKNAELQNIVTETEKDEQRLLAQSKEQEKNIEERYLNAYKRIRRAAHNGLAVVPIDRDACGGCFSKVPPQRQTEIKMHKKVIVCEHCGRIIVDQAIVEIVDEHLQK